MNNDKPIISLGNLGVSGLIIEHPTGAIYTNQAGGHACLHPEMEGAFVPFEIPDEIQCYFFGEKWNCWCYECIDAETADFMDGILASSDFIGKIRVDRDRLEDSCEAWVFVTFPADLHPDDLPYSGFPSGLGVLTWGNSD